MWLLPPDFPRRALSLPPDVRALLWYASRVEIERLMELLRRLIPELREWVWVPWAAVERVGAREPRAGVAMVTSAPPDLDGDQALAQVKRVRWPYVFWRPSEPSEKDGSWLEREVKRALVSELQQELESEEHPLRAQGIEALPVDRVAQATADPVELLAIMQQAVEHRLGRADEGLDRRDWEYSARRAIGEQLAARLEGVKDEVLLCSVLELIVSRGRQPRDRAERTRARERVQACGLGLTVEDSVALGPLARQVEDPIVQGVLLERWIEQWPAGDGGLLGVQSASKSRLRPIRITGPFVPYYARRHAFFHMLREDTELDKQKVPRDLFSLVEAMLRGRLFGDRAKLVEKLPALLRHLDVVQPKLKELESGAVVALLRHLVSPLTNEPPTDVDSFLRRVATEIDRLEQLLPESSKRRRRLIGDWDRKYENLEATVALCMLDYWSSPEQWRALERYAHSKLEGLTDDNAKHDPRTLSEEELWKEVLAELHRLQGRPREAARIRKYGELWRLGSEWEHWSEARSWSEAGEPGRAHESLRRVLQEHRSEEDSLRGFAALELGHIERDRGNANAALEYYRRAMEWLAGTSYTPYAELFELSAELMEHPERPIEFRLAVVRDTVEAQDDPRLRILADLVAGDAFASTHRIDLARDAYGAARERASGGFDTLAEATALEKLATLEEQSTHPRAAAALLEQAAGLHDAAERHRWAAEDRQAAHQLG